MPKDNEKHNRYYEGEPGLIVKAFHGTTLEYALSILRVGFHKFLGVCGIAAYFDIENVRSAVKRALKKAGSEDSARILEVELHLGKCVDLQASEVKVEFQRWQAKYRSRIGEADFRQTSYSRQKEIFLIECFPDVDSAMLIDQDGNKIVGMRNTRRIRILQTRTITQEEVEKYG